MIDLSYVLRYHRMSTKHIQHLLTPPSLNYSALKAEYYFVDNIPYFAEGVLLTLGFLKRKEVADWAKRGYYKFNSNPPPSSANNDIHNHKEIADSTTKHT
jgi:hypothetical protein